MAKKPQTVKGRRASSSLEGWDRLLADASRFRRETAFTIPAYSELMPSPRIGWRPCERNPLAPRDPSNPFAWLISEREQVHELHPGLEIIAREVFAALRHLQENLPFEGISKTLLEGNPFWPSALASRAAELAHERFVTLLPLALSCTQDDKGRVRWTLFGGSEQGPDRAFWKSFYEAPGREKPQEYGVDFVRRLLHAVYNLPSEQLADLRAAGFRILPGSGECMCAHWKQGPLPSWTAPFVIGDEDSVEGVRYVLTFRPFDRIPKSFQETYIRGGLHLLPFPGSLVFWGSRAFVSLDHELPFALQIPLLNVCARHESPRGLRVLQSGWMHEPHDGTTSAPKEARNTYRRTHRWERIERHKDELEVAGKEDHVAHVLFSSAPVDVDLYNKPMARNSQIWDEAHRRVLDGPRAKRKDLIRAAKTVATGGRFGYRFYFPPMVVGSHEIFWHLPLVAYWDPAGKAPHLLDDAPGGYFTCYDTRAAHVSSPVELWPEFQHRPEMVTLAREYEHPFEHHHHQMALNANKLLEVWESLERRPLPRSFARSILTLPKDQTLEQWLHEVATSAARDQGGDILEDTLRRILLPDGDPSLRLLPDPLTYDQTACREFEVTYWNTIAGLSSGRFTNKDNADCVDDPPSKALRKHQKRDLGPLGDWLLTYYRRLIAQRGLRGKAHAGELPFRWSTDFEFPWMKGWLDNQSGKPKERDLLIIIPGRDHRRAVIMADHYDTAYMEDRFYKERGGDFARVSAPGADDNLSATAALMLGAPVFMDLSNAGRLACDVWLVHLTGEEFPSDSMGARHLAQALVNKALRYRTGSGKSPDLSGVSIDGIFVLDMIAHNRFPDQDVFQISPGLSSNAYRLAYEAHIAAMIWNAGASVWNKTPERLGRERGRRSPDGKTVPSIARHPVLHGEVRVPHDPRSSLFNTDGQIFSDVGLPVVLFMENYDINRTGYHDSKDTMENIDLDYGSAVAAIAIESVARAAQRSGKP